jgi:hypothetical protein
MRFNITLTRDYYSPDDIAQYERLGFKFQQIPTGRWRAGDFELVTLPVYKDFDTLEGLCDFAVEFGEVIITQQQIYENNIPTEQTEMCLEIYNGYRE